MIESKLSGPRPDRSRLYGAIICGSTLAIVAVLLDGVRRRSYWALAAPLLLTSLGILSIAFWIGWTLATTRLPPPELSPPTGHTGRDTPPRTRPRSPGQPSAN